MADPDMDEDLFADLYDGEADDPAPPAQAAEPEVKPEPEATLAEPMQAPQEEAEDDDVNFKTEPDQPMQEIKQEQPARDDDYDRPLHIKEDGKMFIGGLNWETTDQSLKDYFSQFGEVLECTVMRDGATGRSRGFGFLTFKNPKDVNIVMVKEHQLDGKLIDPKRAIPREEQERTAKIFVGGVSQECTEWEFKEFFNGFGRVLDATLMMDKNTGRPRGFGFVTFDSDAAVDRTLEQPLAIHNKYVEIKRAEPRGNMRDEEGGGGGGHGKFGGRGGRGGFGGDRGGFGGNQGGGNQMDQGAANGGAGGNNMSASQMAQSWARMQQFYQMMQQQMAASQMANMQNNPAMMQQMMAQRGMGNMSPAMMQQMQGQMQQSGGGGGGNGGGGGSPMNGGQGGQQGNGQGFNAQEQLMFEQQKYEAQQNARMRQGNFQGGNTWDGMYDDVPAPANMRGGFGGGNRGGRGGGGGGGQGGQGGGARNSQTPQPVPNAPAGAPTGPKNAGIPGANYRGGGRGGRRGYHPYARGGG